MDYYSAGAPTPATYDPTLVSDPNTQAQNDMLRSARMFINAGITQLLGDDQVYANTDGMASNMTGQYTVYNPGAGGGLAFDAGASISTPTGTTGARVALSPGLLLVGGMLAFLLLHRH